MSLTSSFIGPKSLPTSVPSCALRLGGCIERHERLSLTPTYNFSLLRNESTRGAFMKGSTVDYRMPHLGPIVKLHPANHTPSLPQTSPGVTFAYCVGFGPLVAGTHEIPDQWSEILFYSCPKKNEVLYLNLYGIFTGLTPTLNRQTCRVASQ